MSPPSRTLRPHFVRSIIVSFLLLAFRPSPICAKSRFHASAPVLTVTLKDPFAQARAASTESSSSSDPAASSADVGLSSLSPTLLWSVRSTTSPLPNYLPSLSSLGLAVGYRYDDIRRLPSFFDGNIRFNFRKWGLLGGGEGGGSVLQVNPSYEVRNGRASAVVQFGGEGGGWYVLGRLARGRGKKLLDVFRASYRRSLPFAAVGSVSATPTHDFVKGESSLVLSGDSGTGRTTATLNLNWDDPTLTVVHALDERNTISPEISLYTAKITYNWNLNLDSGSVRTRVDPTSAVQVTWTDRSMNGKWVTDFKLPLESTMGKMSPLAADIRVRRLFTF